MFKKKIYLKNVQYKTPNNLEARINLNKYSTHPESLWDWVFKHYSMSSDESILEIGSGTGLFWKKIENKIPQKIKITLSDVSNGMLEKCIKLFEKDKRFQFKLSDAENLSFSDQSFDGVISHYMFYHLDSQEKGLNEVKRVLKKNGWFGLLLHAPQSGSRLYELAHLIDSSVDDGMNRDSMLFNSNSAIELLKNQFRIIEKYEYNNPLVIDSAQAVTDFVKSHPSLQIANLNEDFFKEYQNRVTEEILRTGSFIVNTCSVLLIGKNKN